MGHYLCGLFREERTGYEAFLGIINEYDCHGIGYVFNACCWNYVFVKRRERKEMSKCVKCGESIKYTVVYLRGMGDNTYHLDCAKKVK